jgi:hypothetical protein
LVQGARAAVVVRQEPIGRHAVRVIESNLEVVHALVRRGGLHRLEPQRPVVRSQELTWLQLAGTRPAAPFD